MCKERLDCPTLQDKRGWAGPGRAAVNTCCMADMLPDPFEPSYEVML
jgi:hypothetical protein